MENNQQQKPSFLDRFKKRSRPRKPWLLIMTAAVIVGCFVAVFAVFQLKMSSGVDSEAKTSSMQRDVESTPGGDSSEAYREKVREQNKQEAVKALQQGESFMPSVAGQKSSEDSDGDLSQDDLDEEFADDEPDEEESGQESEEAEPVTSVDAEKRAMERRMQEMQNKIETLQRQQQQRPGNGGSQQQGNTEPGVEEYSKQYAEQLNKIDAEIARGRVEHEIQVFDSDEQAAEQAQAAAATASGAGDDGEAANDQGPDLEINSGDILYARSEMRLNSDAPGPAHATVLSGEYKGAKLLGGFEKQNDYLSLEFNRLVLPDGREYKVDSVAIDPEVPETAVRSDVDRHILSRWGGLMAASFLAGFGEATRESGSEVSQSDGESQKSYPEMDAGEQLWSAAGRVGEELSSVMKKNFDRPSTVTLEPGIEIGVLILSIEDQ